jgi:hypothetical protein
MGPTGLDVVDRPLDRDLDGLFGGVHLSEPAEDERAAPGGRGEQRRARVDGRHGQRRAMPLEKRAGVDGQEVVLAVAVGVSVQQPVESLRADPEENLGVERLVPPLRRHATRRLAGTASLRGVLSRIQALPWRG